MSLPIESVFARLAEYLDVPKCGCKVPRVMRCVAAGEPCAERVETGDCSCPLAVPRPCKHALAKLFQLPWLAEEDDLDESRKKMERLLAGFAFLYQKLHPNEFKPVPEPVAISTPAVRLATYMKRAGKTEIVSRRDKSTLAFVGYSPRQAKNGRIVGYEVVREQGASGACRICRAVETLYDGLCGDCSLALTRRPNAVINHDSDRGGEGCNSRVCCGHEA